MKFLKELTLAETEKALKMPVGQGELGETGSGRLYEHNGERAVIEVNLHGVGYFYAGSGSDGCYSADLPTVERHVERVLNAINCLTNKH